MKAELLTTTSNFCIIHFYSTLHYKGVVKLTTNTWHWSLHSDTLMKTDKVLNGLELLHTVSIKL